MKQSVNWKQNHPCLVRMAVPSQNWSTTLDFNGLKNYWSSCKKPRGNTLVCRFFQGIWFHTQQILLAYSLLQETITTMMIFHSNTKVKVCSPGGDINFIVAGVLQGYTSVPYLFIICLDYILWMSIDLIKENDFMVKKARSKWYPVETFMDADYADNIGRCICMKC